MRITEIECSFTDLLWFAVDKNGIIGAFTSGGTGNVPEMICQSKEIPDLLEKYFFENAPIISQCIFTPEQGMKLSKTCHLYNECLDLSSKGLVFYDASDNRTEKQTNGYYKISYPSKYLTLEELPFSIMEIMKNLFFEKADFPNNEFIKVAHAY